MAKKVPFEQVTELQVEFCNLNDCDVETAATSSCRFVEGIK